VARHILALEDDVAIATLYQLIFEDDELEIVASAGAGLEALAWHRPDVVLLDLSLVGSTGEDFLAGLLPPYPPIIVVSANPRAPALAAQIGARMLRKPFDIEEIEGAVAAATASQGDTSSVAT
jgi:DNA-binding response OmpR family regulator